MASRLTGWDVSPFDPQGLADCYPRDHADVADLADDRAAELGVLTVHVARHVESLPNVSRAHVYRIGDG